MTARIDATTETFLRVEPVTKYGTPGYAVVKRGYRPSVGLETVWETGLCDTPDEALNDYFIGWTPGYPFAWIGDGFALCASCARTAWTDEANADHEAMHGGQITRVLMQDTDHDLTCDGCDQYIIEPSCTFCGDDDTTVHERGRLLFQRTSGDAYACSHCLAEAIINAHEYDAGESYAPPHGKALARKIGQSRYDVCQWNAYPWNGTAGPEWVGEFYDPR